MRVGETKSTLLFMKTPNYFFSFHSRSSIVFSKPSSGRKGDHEVVEGACVTKNLFVFTVCALSLSRETRQLPIT